MSQRAEIPPPAEPTLVHTFLRRAEQEPETVFASFERRRPLAFGESADAVRRFAAALGERSIGAGDRVLLALDNSPEFLVSWLGAWHAGATVVPLVPGAGDRLFARALELARPVLAVAGNEGAAKLVAREAGEEVPLLAVEDEPAAPLAPALDAFLASTAAGENLAAGEETASVMFTSGTTGAPKGVCLSHLWFAWASTDVARGMGYDAGDVLYTCLPLGHANAQDTTFGPALVCGGRAAFDRRFSASRFWRRLRSTGATAFNLIGNMPRILLNRDPGEYVDHGAERAFAIPALPAHREEFLRRFGVELLQGYGSTEVGMPVFQDRAEVVPGSCGRPVPGTEVRIEPAGGGEAATGEVGEICVRSSRPGALASGYLGQARRGDEAWRDGWFHSGDLGRLDNEGRLYFAGRMGDVLRRKGENLSAFEVESALLELDSVQECAAVGRQRDEGGDDDILVYVVPAAGRTVTAAQVAAHCLAALGPVGEPAEVSVVERLPRTESGKVAKGLLGGRSALGAAAGKGAVA